MLISRSDRGTLARWWFTIDRPLISAVLLLMSMGVLISMAASPPVAERIGLDSFHFFKSQLFYLFFAVICLITLSFFDTGWVRRASFLGFVGALILMAAALFFGPEIKGAHRWINFGPINLQPSEFAKPCYVVAASWFLAEKTRRPDMPGHVIAYAMAAVFLGMLVLQPDFGQAALVVATTGAMLLVFGIPWVIVFGRRSLERSSPGRRDREGPSNAASRRAPRASSHRGLPIARVACERRQAPLRARREADAPPPRGRPAAPHPHMAATRDSARDPSVRCWCYQPSSQSSASSLLTCRKCNPSAIAPSGPRVRSLQAPAPVVSPDVP